MTASIKRLSFVALLALTATSASSFAEGPKVEVSSFVYVNNAGRVAELCGKVSGVDSAVQVRVLVDVNTNAPGVYNVMAGKDGLFCTLVASYRGTARATLESMGRHAESAVVQASAAAER
jgi:hypothetical protein